MSVGLSHVLRLQKPGVYLHWCPACGKAHALNLSSVDHPTGMKWFFNGNFLRPTFTPGVTLEEGGCRCSYSLRDGYIQFAPDCTHALAGQGVAMPAFPFPSG
jgi:hypothetical protein